MIIHSSFPKLTRFDILNSDNDESLVPEELEITTQNSFVGYEIIEGYARAVNTQPYREIEGVPSLEKTQRHARDTANFWFSNVSRAINEVYNNIQNSLKITRDSAKEYFKELITSLEQVEKREEFAGVMQLYIDDTKLIEEKVKNLSDKLIKFRESLEEDARNYGQVFIEIDKQKTLEEKNIKSIQEEISKINRDIVDLNQEITKKKVKAGELKRKIALSGLFFFSIPGIISLAIHKKQLSNVYSAWKQDENKLA
ncbi:HBL/NHE enterotoxin family protein [Rickettsiella massiliensis]|uniref:HBL/NHE enterotoxin family protein n=1 Tax=Rickettsiella massiliensis TaxID=676517 RepID=UPI00029A7143|nr:HBL/NHE enterotoxin family protein [Rickettsiella massiliensis]